jgi:ribosomal protein S3AE
MIGCRIINGTVYVIIYDDGKYFLEPKTRPATNAEIKHIKEREARKKMDEIIKEREARKKMDEIIKEYKNNR